MTSRRLPDPYLTEREDLEGVKDYITDLVRVLQIELGDVSDKDGFDEKVEKLHSETVTTSGNINRNVAVTLVDASASSVTITLPDPLKARNEVFYIKKINTNANDITIDVITSGAEIDRSSSASITGSDRGSLKIMSDGREYWIL